MSEADKLRELVQKAASAVTSAQQSDFSEVESLLELLEEIGGYVDQVAAIPDQLKEQTKYATTSASEIVQALLAKEIDNTDDSLQSVSRMISTLGALTEQLDFKGNESDLENLVGDGDDIEGIEKAGPEEVKPVGEEQKEAVVEVDDSAAGKVESEPRQKEGVSIEPDSAQAEEPIEEESCDVKGEVEAKTDNSESASVQEKGEISQPKEEVKSDGEAKSDVKSESDDDQAKPEEALQSEESQANSDSQADVELDAEGSVVEEEQDGEQESKEVLSDGGASDARENESVEAEVEAAEEAKESEEIEVSDSDSKPDSGEEVQEQVQGDVEVSEETKQEKISEESEKVESSDVSSSASDSATEQDASKEAESSESEQETAEPTVLDEDDLPLVMDFITEAAEHIESVEAGLLEVENSPGDSEAINLIFRGFHTIKGMAGFLNLTEIGSLAHAAENLLDMGRKGELELTGNNMNVVFDSVDQLKSMMESLQDAVNGSLTVSSNPELPELIARLKACTQGEVAQGAESSSTEGAGEATSTENKVEKAAEAEPQTSQVAEQAEQDGGKAVEESAGESEPVNSSCESAEAVEDKDEAEQKPGEVSETAVKKSAEQEPKAAVEQQEQAESRESTASDAGGVKSDSGPVKKEEKSDEAGSGKEQSEGGGAAKGASLTKKAATSDEKIKVSTQRLDELVNMVGELVIAQSMVIQGVSNNNALSQEHDLFGKINHQGKIVRELQELSMMMRMVPIQGVFQKMARLVRDLSQKSGKKVNFITEGEETELDRIVVDQIADPLVHMIRNSVDHGIEANEDRKQSGKEPIGTVKLRAFHQAGNIVIEIIDDGKGLDKEKILSKAISNGIVSESDNLSDQDVYKLIFSAGLSTAAKVTDISGRGVGMDVVKKNIESLRGKIDIVSEKGKGTTFTIRLPLTMAIIDGQVVRIGSQRYIIPITSIECCISPEEKDINTVAGRGEMAMVHGSLIPMVRLYSLFGVKPDTEVPHEASLVVVEEDGKRGSLMVDELLGQHQVVIKSLGGGLSNVAGISGGAIMGDGKVSLIIDVPSLLETAWNS